MPSQQQVCCFFYWISLANVLASGTASAQDENARPEMRADAELSDVFFIDADQGWAVGDRGVIWSSVDGGRHWGSQNSGVSCRLNSVSFINHSTGWAVGGWTHPYTHRSRGTVIKTSDGGRTWQPIKGLSLPLLKRVKFVDARRGWVIGDTSVTYPNGVMYTDDGGRSWTGATGGSGTFWTAGDISEDGRGALIGFGSKWTVVNRRRIQTSQGPTLGLAVAHDLKLVGRRQGWCVGDDGNVWQTLDAGLTWKRPIGRSPAGMSRHFGFFAVAALGSNCWIAGAPGTMVFRSTDHGKSWRAWPTDQTMPLRKLMFLDANRGWAVGSLGVILSTRDGGKTWRWQRGGGQRVAMLAIAEDANSLPFELLARQSADEGYLSAAEIIGCPELENRTHHTAALRRRTHEAMLKVGGSVADTSWRFPLRQPGIDLPKEYVINLWNRVNNGQAVAQLEEHLVLKIRQWRPDVLIVPQVDAGDSNPLPRMLHQAILAATEKAANVDAYREQLSTVGLKPWQVKKTYSRTSNQREATQQVVTSGLAPHLGRSLSDISSEGRALLHVQPKPAPTMIGYRLLASDLPAGIGRRDMFSGIALQPGSEARRFRGQPPAASMDELRRTVQKRRNIEQLLSRASEDAQAGMSWLAQVDDLTRGLNPNHAAGVFFQLAMQYHKVGQSELAADVLEQLVQQFRNHELVEPSVQWLIRYWTSGEVRWRLARRAGLRKVTTQATAVQQATFHRAVDASPVQDEFLRKVEALSKMAQKTRPWMMVEPDLRFPIAASKRMAGARSEATRTFNSLSQSAHQNLWNKNARMELWLSKPTKVAPKPIVSCAKTETKPHLDGKLDDPCWVNSKVVELKSVMRDDQSWPANAMFAYDDDHLYLGVACNKAIGANYSAAAGLRKHDMELSTQDRIDILIDIDRDYTSYYRLTIDHRGWLAEQCMGDASWNPEWFVAAESDGQQWFLEAAIPLSELVSVSPKSQAAWAVGVQRTIPGVGFQSWTPGATEPIPAEFGILLFD